MGNWTGENLPNLSSWPCQLLNCCPYHPVGGRGSQLLTAGFREALPGVDGKRFPFALIPEYQTCGAGRVFAPLLLRSPAPGAERREQQCESSACFSHPHFGGGEGLAPLLPLLPSLKPGAEQGNSCFGGKEACPFPTSGIAQLGVRAEGSLLQCSLRSTSRGQEWSRRCCFSLFHKPWSRVGAGNISPWIHYHLGTRRNE